MIFGRFTVKTLCAFGVVKIVSCFRYFILHERHLFPAFHITNCTFFTNFKTLVIHTINLLVVLWYKNWQTDIIIFENYKTSIPGTFTWNYALSSFQVYNNNKCPVTKILVILFLFFSLMLMVRTLQEMSLKTGCFIGHVFYFNYLDNFAITVFFALTAIL